MTRVSPWALCLAVGLVLTVTQPADAQSATRPVRADPRSGLAVSLAGFHGPAGRSGHNVAMVFGAQLMTKLDFLRFGVQGDYAFGLPLTHASVAAIAGFGVSPTAHLDVSVVGQLGRVQYAGWGGQEEDDPGADAILPFAGVQAEIRINFRKSSPAIGLHVRGYYRDDLHRDTVTYRYNEWLLFANGDEHVVTRRVGGSGFAAQFGLGVTWGR